MSKNTEKFIQLKQVNRAVPLRRGVELEVDKELVRLEFVTDSILRIKISKGGQFDPKPTFAVICDEFGTPDFSLNIGKKQIVIASKKLICTINVDGFGYAITRTDGTELYHTTESKAYGFLNNQWCVERSSSQDDTYIGFGEKTAGLNQNGRFLQMWNTDVLSPNHSGVITAGLDKEDVASIKFDPYYVSIPFYYYIDAKQRAFGSFIDNGYHLYYDLRNEGSAEICARGGQFTEYVIAGPALDSILNNYNLLTGLPALPPLWSLGHHQCRWEKYSDKQLLELGREYRKRQIPCDVLWLDIDYMDKYKVFTWNKELFPNPSKTLDASKKDGFRVITIIDPGVKYEPGYPVFDEGTERQLFCLTESGQTYVGHVWPGLTAFPDFVNEEARRWWGRLNADHVKSGLAGIWNDMNEPASWLPVDDMRFDRNRYEHAKYHNSYALLQAMGTRDGLKDAMPTLRTFILSRGGSAGIQRYAANWCGDNCSIWEHLEMSVYMNCNFAISGQPFVGGDIGGFCRDTDGELLTRWYEYGIFQPFCRNHSACGTKQQYPWSFGEEYETPIKQAIDLRYRLLPYLYTSTMRYSQTNIPPMRPLVFDYQQDSNVTNCSTEFMFGPDMLVAPVCKPKMRNRSFYLPKDDWYEFNTSKLYNGGQEVKIPAPLDRIPVMVKAGAVIPLSPVIQSTMLEKIKEITLRVFVPTTDGTYRSYLYEDDGLTEKCVDGEYLSTELKLVKKGKTLTLTGKTSGKGFCEFARTLFVVEFVGAKIAPITLKNSGQNFDLSVKL